MPAKPEYGAGLRSSHYPYLLERPRTGVSWFEAISENYMDSRGRPRHMLEFIRRDYPVALHGVSLSIGAVDGPDPQYLKNLKVLIEAVDPFLVSDHFCFSRHGRHSLHDLLPLRFTPESLGIVCDNISQVQDALGRQLVLENVSSYLTSGESVMEEWDFIAKTVSKTGAGILLDINNIFVSARNHGFVPEEYLRGIPLQSVKQMHLAGHTDTGEFLFDTHSAPVCAEVWELFRAARPELMDVPVLLEWDENIPEFPVLEKELEIAAAITGELRLHQRAEKAGADG